MSENGAEAPRERGGIKRLIKHPVLHGHPLHAMASDLPVTLMPAAFAISVVAGDKRKPRLLQAGATLTTRAAFASAAVAGGLGWWDWLTMPAEHGARRTSTLHGLLNTGALALVGAAAVTRGNTRSALLGATVGGLLVSAWLGGDIVFTYGWRVRPAEEAEIVGAQLQQRGLDDIVVAARREVSDFEQRETYVPPRGP